MLVSGSLLSACWQINIGTDTVQAASGSVSGTATVTISTIPAYLTADAGYNFVALFVNPVTQPWYSGDTLYSSTSSSGPFNLIGFNYGPTSDGYGGDYFVDTPDVPGMTYYYYVQAYDIDNDTELDGPSNIASATPGPYPATPISCGSTVQGTLTTAGHYGYIDNGGNSLEPAVDYSYQATANQPVTISLTSPDMPYSVLSVVDPNYNVIETVGYYGSTGAVNAPQICFVPTTTGTYTFEVASYPANSPNGVGYDAYQNPGTYIGSYTLGLNCGTGQTLTSITVTPVSATIDFGYDQIFTAVGLDQSGNPIQMNLPFVWSTANGSNTLTPDGSTADYLANSAPGPDTVTASINGISGSASVNVVVVPPTPPTNLTATIYGIDVIQLNWTGGIGAQSFIVERSLDGVTGWTQISTNATSPYYDYPLTPSTTYYYQVIAVNSAASSSPSNIASATTPSRSPTNLTAAAGLGQITLNWQGWPGGSYTVYRGDVSGGENLLLTPQPIVATTFTDTGLSGKPYYYVVYGNASPAPSNEASAIPLSPNGTAIYQINCGGPGSGTDPSVAPWIADTCFSGGQANGDSTGVDTSQAANPAPYEVYMSWREGNSFSYSLPGLTPNGQYAVRLHYSQGPFVGLGQHVFNATIDGSQVLTNFDVYAAAGAVNTAYTQEFNTTADGTGAITVSEQAVQGTAILNGLEVINEADPAGPTVAVAASASPNPTTGATTNVSVLGADVSGESTLTYSWYGSGTWTGSGPGGVTFSPNGTNASKNATATFYSPGVYTLTVLISDADGQTVTSSVSVTVISTFTSIDVAPATITVNPGESAQFSAVAVDQFGTAMNPQPDITWTTAPSGAGGAVGAGGLYTAPGTTGGSDVVEASSGSIMGDAAITIGQQLLSGPENPQCTLVLGSDGWLYGTAAGGLANTGTIFKFNPVTRAIDTLHNFSAGGTVYSGFSTNLDGIQPLQGLSLGIDGSTMFSTTEEGGATGIGTIYKIGQLGNFTPLYSFQGGFIGGGYPPTGVVQDGGGNLDGGYNLGDGGMGTVFSYSGALNVWHSFIGIDGQQPQATLCVGSDGNLYGTTSEGGTTYQPADPPVSYGNPGNGTAFEVTPGGSFITLHNFDTDGANPLAALTQGADGNFYGTCSDGGFNSGGSIFQLVPGGLEGGTPSIVNVLHNFPSDLLDGIGPAGKILILPDGSMYGTTQFGGAAVNSVDALVEGGTVWKIDVSGNYSILHSFSGEVAGDPQDSDGSEPIGGLCLGADGNLYGTTAAGGAYGFGTIYSISPNGDYSLLLSLNSPLTAPGGFTVAVTSASCVSLNWNLVPGAESYTIKRSTTPGGSFTTVGNTTSNSYEDCSLTSGQTYYYEVVPVLDGVEGLPTLVISITISSAPAGPANLTATPGSTTITLNWSALASATSYTVQRSTISGGPYTAIATVDAPAVTYQDTGLTNGETYYYVVSASTPEGQTQNSNQAYATPSTPGPLNLVAIAGTSDVSLTWTAYSGAASYNVKRSTSDNGPWDTIATPTTNSQVDGSVQNGTTYYYTVSAVSGGSETANSNVVSATPGYPGEAPAQLTATPGNAQVTLSWISIDPTVISFNVYRSTTSGTGYALLVSIPAASSTTGANGYNTYVDQTAQNGVTYYYVVTGVNNIGEGGDSNQASATPEAPPATPTNLTATPGNASVNLTWTENDVLATSFTIERGTASGGPYEELLTMPITTVSGPQGYEFDDNGSFPLDEDTTNSVVNGTTYYYVVLTNDAGGSSPSIEVPGTPALSIPQPPDALKAEAGDTLVNLAWDLSQNATSYNLYRSTTSGSGYVLDSTAASLSTLSASDIGLTDGVTYYYVVTAVNVAGESGYSVEVSATPEPTVLTAAQAEQIATSFCQAIGVTTTDVPTAQFPAPMRDATSADNYWQPCWLVTFGDNQTVCVTDATSVVTRFYNQGLELQTMVSGQAAGTAISQSNAMTIASLVTEASTVAQSELGTAQYQEVEETQPPLQLGHQLWITWPRQYQGVPYFEDQATVLLQAETGGVISFCLAFRSVPPDSNTLTITADQADQSASTQLAAAGISGATLLTTNLTAVQPNNFWQTGDPTFTALTSTVAWDCYYTIDPLHYYDVWVDEQTGAVIGGDLTILKHLPASQSAHMSVGQQQKKKVSKSNRISGFRPVMHGHFPSEVRSKILKRRK